MNDRNHENERLRRLLIRLLDASTGEDAMICHDGGFRYSGDFMSMESDLIEPAALLDPDEFRALRERGFVEADGETVAVRVTDAGRAFAFEEDVQIP